MGVIKWTEKEKEFLKENVKKMDNFELSARLGRTYSAVVKMKSRMGISPGNYGGRPKISKEKRNVDDTYTLRMIKKYAKYKKIADGLKVGQKTMYGTIKELYPHIAIVQKNGKDYCYRRIEVVGYINYDPREECLEIID